VKNHNLVDVDQFNAWQAEDYAESVLLQERVSQRLIEARFFSAITKVENQNIFSKFLLTFYKKIQKKPDGKFFLKKIFTFFPRNLREYFFFIIFRNLSGLISGPEFNFGNNSPELGFGICTSKNPQVTIVIPIYNNLEITLECLRSLQLAALESEIEIIVIDDASADFSVEVFENIRGIRYVRLCENVGYTKATNIGASYAKGNYIFLLNNDAVVIPGCIPQLLKCFSSQPNVGIVGATLLNADYSVQESGSQVFRDGSGRNLGSGFHVSDPRLQFSREVDYCSAAAIMVKRTLWLSVSGFDERFAPAYFEDTDLCFAAWKNDLKVVVSNNAYVIHQRSSSYGKANDELMRINRDKFNLKWALVLEKHWKNKGEVRFESSRSSKGIVVLVDDFLPSFSRNSGSIRTIKLLTTISDLGYHVCLTALSNKITPLNSQKLSDLGFEFYPDASSLIAGLKDRKNRVLYLGLIPEELNNTYFDVLFKEFPKAGSVKELLDLNYSSGRAGSE
jgi:GT2 family glycosyltransferase